VYFLPANHKLTFWFPVLLQAVAFASEQARNDADARKDVTADTSQPSESSYTDITAAEVNGNSVVEPGMAITDGS
jgi:hypothetical protein